MKIGVDAREFVENGKTGIGRYLENLLAPLVRGGGLDFVLFVKRPEFVPASLRIPSVKIAGLPGLPTPVLDQVVLPRLAGREQVDLFFSPYYKVPLSGRFKRIIIVHDIMFLRRKELNPVMRMLVARRLRASTRKADVILVSSDFTGRDLNDFLPGLTGKIRRLYPDLSADWLKPVEPSHVSALRKTYADGKPFFLYVGNFNPHKNVDLLVRSFAQLVREKMAGDRLLLLAGGDAGNRSRIGKLVSGLGVAARVTIHSNVPDGDLRGLYAAADWFVTASGYEGFGYPVLEAMALGCPVICAPCTSLPEVVGNAALEISVLKVAGVMNALIRALKLPLAERRSLAEKGKIQAKLFRPGTTAAGFSRILSGLV